MNRKVFLAASASLLFPIVALGQAPINLTGTWVIDTEKTASNITKIGPPANHGEWLPSIVLRMCLIAMNFDREDLQITSIGPIPSGQNLRLKSQEHGKLTYVPESKNEPKDTWTIAFFSDENFSVSSSNMPLMEYGVWKRASRPSPQAGEQAFKQAFSDCASALEKVPFLKIKQRQ